jgi:hypothetical protein
VKKFRKIIRRWLIRRRVAKLRTTIRRIDMVIKRDGWPNWKRKQLWRDFIRSAEFRSAFIDSISKTIGKGG